MNYGAYLDKAIAAIKREKKLILASAIATVVGVVIGKAVL